MPGNPNTNEPGTDAATHHSLDIHESGDVKDILGKPILQKERFPFKVKVEVLGPINGKVYAKGETVMLTAERGERHRSAGDLE